MPEQTTEDRIADQLAGLMTEYYGHGPAGAKGYMTEGCVVVVLDETFSVAERTLIDHGDGDDVQRIRRRFQREMAGDFKSIVERATGRQVDTFISDTDVESSVSVEVFLLGEAMADMGGFEDQAGADQ